MNRVHGSENKTHRRDPGLPTVLMEEVLKTLHWRSKGFRNWPCKESAWKMFMFVLFGSSLNTSFYRERGRLNNGHWLAPTQPISQLVNWSCNLVPRWEQSKAIMWLVQDHAVNLWLKRAYNTGLLTFLCHPCKPPISFTAVGSAF